jgi:hypothetical protein
MPTGAFIISIVPLNFGAAAPLRLNPHFLQVFDASSFSVPQFGQNTLSPPVHPARAARGGPAAYTSSLAVLNTKAAVSVVLIVSAR